MFEPYVLERPGGDTGDPGDREPVEQPEEGDRRTGHQYESCEVNNPNPSEENPGCGAVVQCEGENEPVNHYTRPEVYHRDTGWIWTGGGGGTEAGDGWMYEGTICQEPQEDVPSEAEVWRAVRELQFPGATLELEPPNGRTLVNFPTNFYTTSANDWGPRDIQVGQATVQVRATPQRFRWDFGDGSDPLTTGSPGDQYPNTEIVHKYEELGTFTPSVTVLYHVEWQYDGSGWQAFDELVPAAASPTTSIQVVEKINRLSD